MENLPNYLKELRGERSVREVADEMGVSFMFLYQLENPNRKYKPKVDTLRLVADYYDISLIDILLKIGYVTDEDLEKGGFIRVEDEEYKGLNKKRFRTD